MFFKWDGGDLISLKILLLGVVLFIFKLLMEEYCWPDVAKQV